MEIRAHQYHTHEPNMYSLVNTILRLRIAWFITHCKVDFTCATKWSNFWLFSSHPSTSKTSHSSWRCATDVRKYSHNFFMLPNVSWHPVTPASTWARAGQEVNTWETFSASHYEMRLNSNRSRTLANDTRILSSPLGVARANSHSAPSPPGKSPLFMRPWQSPGKCVGAERAKSSHISASTPRTRGVTPRSSLTLSAETKLLIMHQFSSTLSGEEGC